MAGLIEDYAIVGDTRTVALIDRGGSVDWWCAPSVDSAACFSALVGAPEHGRWLLRPDGDVVSTRRHYRGDTLVLETEHETSGGTVAVIDFMVPGLDHPALFRIVEGRTGTVPMQLELVTRFDYGSVVPWVQATGDGVTMVAGPDAIRFHSSVPLRHEDQRTLAEFTISEGQRRTFSAAWYSSRTTPPHPLDAYGALATTTAWWEEWSSRCTYDGPWREDVMRSLITLKALTYAPTGAVVAAATTSLPEQIGSVRNWDYRYSWLRDASFTLQALVSTGYIEEARAWSDWLRRAVAGSPGEFQIMYDVQGRRRLTELSLDWLPGYEGSAPVRVGNGASGQFQLDVFGEVLDAALTAVQSGLLVGEKREHDMMVPTLDHLDRVWQLPDDGIWEIRGPQRHFTHSKAMAWVAYDRAIKIADLLGEHDWPVDRWRTTRDEIHAQVCEKGWNAAKSTFVQYYGGEQVDSSLLILSRMGFLPADDPRIVGTVEAIQRELSVDGFVLRYPTEGDESVDGLPAGEGTFLMTTFWLADNLAMIGRTKEALEIFERLRGLRNDVGLLSEEYDPVAKRMLGNFPQAFSHLAFIVSALGLVPDHAEIAATDPVAGP